MTMRRLLCFPCSTAATLWKRWKAMPHRKAAQLMKVGAAAVLFTLAVLSIISNLKRLQSQGEDDNVDDTIYDERWDVFRLDASHLKKVPQWHLPPPSTKDGNPHDLRHLASHKDSKKSIPKAPNAHVQPVVKIPTPKLPSVSNMNTNDHAAPEFEKMKHEESYHHDKAPSKQMKSSDNKPSESSKQLSVSTSQTAATLVSPGSKRYATCKDTKPPESMFQTCEGRSLKAGYVLALQSWEQHAPGSANFMSLQCWAATMSMVVAEPITDTQVWHIPQRMVTMANTTTEVYGATLSDIYDLQEWNQYTKDNCYAPIVQWKDFLCHAPRKAILVHITYSGQNKAIDVADCSAQELKNYKDRFSRFFNAHGFEIVRQVCINQLKQKMTTKTFNEYILGNYSSGVTIMIDRWRGVNNGGSSRVGITGTECGWASFLTLPFKKPSQRILAEIKLLQEKVMDNEEYIAVLVRNEYTVKGLLQGQDHESWSRIYDGCLEGATTAWRDVKASHPELKKVFWFFDIAYGASDLSKVAKDAYNRFMMKHFNKTYSEFEKVLVNSGGLPAAAYITTLQQHMSARAKCLVLVGDGPLHWRTRTLYESVHEGSKCTVQYNAAWHSQKCKQYVGLL